MGPYIPGPLSENAVDLVQLAAYTHRELKKVGEITRRAERDLIGSITVTAAYQVLANDALVRANAAGGAFSATLPPASAVVGQRVTVKRLNSGANAVAVAGHGTDLIDGAASVSLAAQYASVTVVAWRDGTSFGWDVL